ncbi:dihydroorotate dehydrogenase (quinone) [Rhodothalassium salexigens]|uniref:quinone-dependent dihydroorotate dehydrogenase n=1 Tax=Rhodothalassium salexigens TaxID=1086 RepID=UPI00191260AB|nr:quinone-dependent dihydroorotate dehydrogenase [Rhodothalassium salexigens]MBK5912260.1 dihydroorotate dehydrogenase (quinone) [Rhodothalassium salexigens]MBK5921419.1 dihydroorotate dehydrogenase (quinone) [Rhodothalassium salexigens]
MSGAFALARPVLHALPGETAHALTLAALRVGLAPRAPAPDPALARTVCGLRFPGPVGLAAGFDKDALAPRALFRLGFGFVEVGTLTPRPQPGNPRPRLFRLAADRAVINRMGFNNAGHEAAARRLDAVRAAGPLPGPLGVNIGANKDSDDRIADYCAGVRRFAGLADYLTVNISSPNTPGLRGLQSGAAFAELVDRVLDTRAGLAERPPVFVKLAPDLTEADLDAIAAQAIDAGVDGLIAGNTTVSRPAGLGAAEAGETGGLSGRPLFDLATATLAGLCARLDGALPVIGVGGIDSVATARAKLDAGAALVQVYTGLVFEGPGLVSTINRGLSAPAAA